MEQMTPEQTPEGRMIQEWAKRTGESVRQLAAKAGISDTRWRQIVKGWQPAAGGMKIPVRGNAQTLARMNMAIGRTADALADAGRVDAAEAQLELEQAAKRVDIVAATSMISVGIDPEHPVGGDELIDLIYADKNMTAQEKLIRIRQVMELRAQAADQPAIPMFRRADSSSASASEDTEAEWQVNEEALPEEPER
ncbi:hypothetical protein [Actinoplanes sp. NPDC051851]|uniref:hypothetical protein n=1 Tax=Actinoplanes sp. NPDC051851 TaxID=3154753 RepID=UPI00342C2DBB